MALMSSMTSTPLKPSTGTDRDRVISITLSEEEWQAFVARHPQPVAWLRDRIRTEVQDGRVEGLQEETRRR